LTCALLAAAALKNARALDPEVGMGNPLPTSGLKADLTVLANLNRYRGLLNGDEIPRTTEILLSFDEPFDEFRRKLQAMGGFERGPRRHDRPGWPA
jgi:hypothetical protein